MGDVADAKRSSGDDSMSLQATLAAPELGTVVDGRYTLQRLLGKGGMGAVYEAHTADGSRVAVKILIGGVTADEQALQRFMQEAALTAELEHPNIVRAIEVGVDDALRAPFMVMELMVGLDVDQLIDQLGPIHPTLAVRIVRQACNALEAAHAQGIVHRDMKPANIFLDHAPDGRITARIMDFGIAKYVSNHQGGLTATGTLLGTPMYMAPEQLKDTKRVDARADVWSLALALYETLSADLPHQDLMHFAELIVAITADDTPWLQETAPWVDGGLARVIHGALLRDIDARCPSVMELARALEPFSGGSDELHVSMLQKVPNAMLESELPRADRPDTWQAAAPTRKAPHITVGESDPLLGETLGDRYELLRCLGRGGMGAVYEARLPDQARVAVKVVRPELAGMSRSARRRFVQEARVVENLENPHVVRVIEVAAGTDEVLPFIAMELLCGSDLDRVLKRQGALRPKIVARIFSQACAGLAAAHDRGFVHRDVKPANLFLHSMPSGEVVVKLCDFGIAKQMVTDESATEALTATGGVIGSPMYMSPEQATNSKTIDVRSDVWSLGATMYQALCGGPPWEGKESMGELVLAVCTERLPHLQDRAPWVPEGLADTVHRAMRRDPSDRYQSADAFADALRPYVGKRTTVLETQLSGVSGDARARRATRAAATEPTKSQGGIAHPVPREPKRKIALSAVVAALAAAGTVYYVQQKPAAPVTPEPAATQEATTPTTTATQTPAPPIMSARAHEVRIGIAPATATVTVDGKERSLVDGHLVLAAEPGDRFAIVVSEGRRKIEETVFVGKDGTASSERIELPAASRAAPRPTPITQPTAAPPRPPPPPAVEPTVKGRNKWD